MTAYLNSLEKLSVFSVNPNKHKITEMLLCIPYR